MERFDDVLENRGGSYILPFFWLHGEAHEILREEIDRHAVYGNSVLNRVHILISWVSSGGAIWI